MSIVKNESHGRCWQVNIEIINNFSIHVDVKGILVVGAGDTVQSGEK